MEVLQHHIKQEVCLTRPKYREGRIPKVVKVSLKLDYCKLKKESS